MATAYIKELVNATSSEIVYPITKSQAVYMSDNSTTVQKAIEDLSALKNVPALDSQTSPNVSDLLTIFRNTNSTGYKALVSDVAKTIIESYQSSSLAGKTQSVKEALDSLNSSHPLYTSITGSSGADNRKISFAITPTDSREHMIFYVGVGSGITSVVFMLYYRPSTNVIMVKSLGDLNVTASMSDTAAIVTATNWMKGIFISNYPETLSFVP